MRVYGDIEHVNLATGERFRRVSGDGESRLVSCCDHTRLGPTPETDEQFQRRNEEIVDQFIKRLQEKSMSVRAKFQVQEVTSFHWHPTIKKITLRPMYDGTIPEDRRFAKATPSGEFWMNVDNPAASDQLIPGRFYYLDISPVEEEKK